MSESPAQPALDPEMHERVCSWFIGPHAENFDALHTIFAGVLEDHRQARLTHFPTDGVRSVYFEYPHVTHFA